MTFEDISIFLQSTELSAKVYSADCIGSRVVFLGKDAIDDTLIKDKLVLVGILEDRGNSQNLGSSDAPEKVRSYLYQLKVGGYETEILDLGNIQPGFEKQDSYFAVSQVIQYLLRKNATIIVIGGSQDLTYPIYSAFEKLEQTVNLASIDPRFDVGELDGDIDSTNFIGRIVAHQPNYLFNYSNLGYQSYFTDLKTIELMQKLYFDAYRLGELKDNMEIAEPAVRNADIVSFDISAIRSADAIGHAQTTPNGFNGEDACRISRYAGISDKLSVFGLFEVNPKFDNRDQTVFLAAEMLWYFMNGYFNRINDYPIVDKSIYTRYSVPIKDDRYEIVFYKSNKSERWWMEVPYPSRPNSKYDRHYMVPCSYLDYQVACNDEIPDRWWQTYQKLH
jgi:arginase family enzyme